MYSNHFFQSGKRCETTKRQILTKKYLLYANHSGSNEWHGIPSITRYIRETGAPGITWLSTLGQGRFALPSPHCTRKNHAWAHQSPGTNESCKADNRKDHTVGTHTKIYLVFVLGYSGYILLFLILNFASYPFLFNTKDKISEVDCGSGRNFNFNIC